jgi:hypothetical protein
VACVVALQCEAVRVTRLESTGRGFAGLGLVRTPWLRHVGRFWRFSPLVLYAHAMQNIIAHVVEEAMQEFTTHTLRYFVVQQVGNVVLEPTL